MTPLAEAVYEILRSRPGMPEPRISYAELGRRLRDVSDDFEYVTHRSRELYAALGEVAGECRRLGLPCLAALVVRADSGRPGAAYFQGMADAQHTGERVAAWRDEVEAVKQATYPGKEERASGEQ